MPIPNPMGRLCGDGAIYLDTSETQGVSITGDGVALDFQVAECTWIYNPGGPTSASFNYFSDLAQHDASLVDCFALSSIANGSSQTVAAVNCYGNGTNRYTHLEAGVVKMAQT